MTGSADKVEWLKSIGCDLVVNYKTDDLETKLKEFAPGGINGYFENTGGVCTEAVLKCCALNAKVAVCGIISSYNDGQTSLKNYQLIIHKRITMKGFLCLDDHDKIPAFVEYTKRLIAEGKLKYKLDVQEGFENYTKTLNMLFDGKNQGKLVLKINDE